MSENTAVEPEPDKGRVQRPSQSITDETHWQQLSVTAYRHQSPLLNQPRHQRQTDGTVTIQVLQEEKQFIQRASWKKYPSPEKLDCVMPQKKTKNKQQIVVIPK